jgi:CBS domain-containing protein
MEQRTQVANGATRHSAARREAPATIGDIMTTELESVSPDTAIEKVVDIFDRSLFRHMVVIDADGRLAGVLSDRDVLRHVTKSQANRAARVKDIMTRQVATATPHMPLKTAIDILVFKKIDCLPVLDGGGEVCGLVTTTDLLAALHEMLNR